MNAVYNRRRFLSAAVQAVAGVTSTGWASAVRAAPGQLAAGAGGFTLIDTHTHFYDPTRAGGVPWPPREDKHLYRTVREDLAPGHHPAALLLLPAKIGDGVEVLLLALNIPGVSTPVHGGVRATSSAFLRWGTFGKTGSA
jgi:hypothetical protein